MRVKVDPDICIGSSACEDTCPEVFKVIDGLSVVQKDPVPPALEEKTRETVDACPVGAISIVED